MLTNCDLKHKVNQSRYIIMPLAIAAFFSCFNNEILAATADQLTEQASNRAERLLREKAEQEAFEAQIADPSKPVQLPEPDELPDFSEEEVCFSIKNIEVEGVLAESIHAQGEQYIGKCIGQQTVSAYIQVINQQLLSKGLITTRAVLPEQNLAEGILRIQVLAGTIEEIIFPADYKAIWRHALPMKAGDVLNMRDLEQGIDQLNRLNSQDIELKVEPGDEAGKSNVVAYIKNAKPWQYSLSTDDNGSEDTGKYPLSKTLTLNNLFNIQDVLTYSTSQDADTNDDAGSTSENLSLSVPFGYWTLSMDLSRFDYKQTVIGDIETFVLTGFGHDEKLTVDHVAFRDNSVKLSWSFGLKKRTRRNFNDDVEKLVQTRHLTNLFLSGNYRHYLGSTILNMSATVDQGVELLNSEKVDRSPAAKAANSAQPNYRLYSLSASLNAPFSVLEKQLTYSGQFRLQYADTPLYSLDWFTNGGRYTVRGFSSDESLSAATGWRLRNDVTVPFSIGDYSTSSYVGIDVGGVSATETDNVEDGLLMGMALGVKGNIKELNYDFFVSQPIFYPGPFTEEGACCQAGFSLSYSF
ncbi:ShlB/FhaC/HecB family hemolysin secretion/activation protein [Marinomonas agarivorans]|nr:ShlB/FhaC/HecB family hemolysin secretion/activation protein [Marinomonas agarivorans]